MRCYQFIYVRANDLERQTRVHVEANGFVIADDFAAAPTPIAAGDLVEHLVEIIETPIAQKRLGEAVLSVLTFLDDTAAVEVMASFQDGRWLDLTRPDEPVDNWDTIREAIVYALTGLAELTSSLVRGEVSGS